MTALGYIFHVISSAVRLTRWIQIAGDILQVFKVLVLLIINMTHLKFSIHAVQITFRLQI